MFLSCKQSQILHEIKPKEKRNLRNNDEQENVYCFNSDVFSIRSKFSDLKSIEFHLSYIFFFFLIFIIESMSLFLMKLQLSPCVND